MTEIDLAHQFLGQALVSLVDPHVSACASVRDSTVENIRDLGTTVSDARWRTVLETAQKTVNNLSEVLRSFEQAHDPLVESRLLVGKYVESVAPAPDAAIFLSDSDEDDPERVGSDEEIIT